MTIKDTGAGLIGMARTLYLERTTFSNSEPDAHAQAVSRPPPHHHLPSKLPSPQTLHLLNLIDMHYIAYCNRIGVVASYAVPTPPPPGSCSSFPSSALYCMYPA